MSLELPVPSTLLQVTWLLVGFTFSRAFAKNLDRSVQETTLFKAQGKFAQTLIKNLLNFLHHFWIGLLLIVYSAPIASPLRFSPDIITFFGLGLFLDDLPDIPQRFRKYFQSLFATTQTA